MKILKYIVPGFLMASVLLLVSNNILAAVVSVVPALTNRNVAVGQTNYKTVRWTVVVSTPISPITSTLITFRLPGTSSPGPIVGTSSVTISRPIMPNVSTYTITENMRIPSSVIYKARKMGARRILAIRTFTDGGSSLSATANM